MKPKQRVHICIDTLENGWVAQVKRMPWEPGAVLKIDLRDGEDLQDALGRVEGLMELMEDAKGKQYFAGTFHELAELLHGLRFEEMPGFKLDPEGHRDEILRKMFEAKEKGEHE